MATGRTPDYDLVVMNKTTQQKGKVGAAWKNNDGRIGIVLNPCVVLSADPNLVIALFVKHSYEGPKLGSYKNADEAFATAEEPKEDDCPF